MSEKLEDGNESVPNEREVALKFDKILEGREFTELEKTFDEEGLLIWTVKTVDDYGDRLDIDYKRAYKSSMEFIEISAIHQTLYTSDGIPCGAGTEYKYINGTWKETT